MGFASAQVTGDFFAYQMVCLGVDCADQWQHDLPAMRMARKHQIGLLDTWLCQDIWIVAE